MRRYLIVYLVSIHALLLVVFLKSDFIYLISKKIWPNREYVEGSFHYHEMLAYHKRMDGNIPKNATIFIGDSLTQSLAVSAITPYAVNYGIGHDTSKGVLDRLNQYTSIQHSKIIVIAIGINDLKFNKKEKEILSNLEKIIKILPNKKPIIFNSMHPVDEQSLNSDSIKNRKITSINSDLEKICSKYSNVHFIDTYKVLSNNSGNLLNKYHVGDGLHLNTQGYQVWINLIRENFLENKLYEHLPIQHQNKLGT